MIDRWSDVSRPNKMDMLKAILFGKRYVCTDVDRGVSCTVTGYLYRGVEYIVKIRRIY